MKDSSALKVAIVHDWLVREGGAEYVLSVLLDMFPNAEVHTLFCNKKAISRKIVDRVVHVSWLNKLPFVFTYYQCLLPLMPLVVEQFDFSGYDLVISSSWAVTKGLVVPSGVKHIAYIYSPMRYLWDLKDVYIKGSGVFQVVRKICAQPVLHCLRVWESAAFRRPDCVISTSEFVAQRMRAYFGMETKVVYPPVEVCRADSMGLSGAKQDYYLMVTSFEPNKRVPYAVSIFNKLGRTLIVAGSGGREQHMSRKIAGKNIRFLGRVPTAERDHLLREARAVIIPGVEDFGLVAVEAMAAGTSVIAYDRGGTAEILRQERKMATGLMEGLVLFGGDGGMSLEEAVVTFERLYTKPQAHGRSLRKVARKYCKPVFEEAFQKVVADILK